MILSHVVAVAKDNAIGIDGKLPWHISSELKQFKRRTSNHILIMGRKTMESLPFVLPTRFNMVLSRSLSEGDHDGFWVVNSFEAMNRKVASLISKGWPEEVFCIGGAEIYRTTIAQCQNIYLTEVETTVDGADAFYDAGLLDGFDEQDRQHVGDDASGLNMDYIKYTRK